MILHIISWNINGKTELLQSKHVQRFIDNFNMVFLTETCATPRKSIKSEIFVIYEYPDYDCNIEHPRHTVHS